MKSVRKRKEAGELRVDDGDDTGLACSVSEELAPRDIRDEIIWSVYSSLE